MNGSQPWRSRGLPRTCVRCSLRSWDPMREGSAMSESETQADVFVALRELAEVVPEMRAGQLMAAVGELCADLHGRGLWDAPDTELLDAVWLFRRNRLSRLTHGSLGQNVSG